MAAHALDDEPWDSVVVGGGAAGLSAAIVLARARRRTLLVDAGEPSNAPAEAMGGLVGFDGRPPADLVAAGRADLARYPSVEVRSGRIVGGRRQPDGTFELDTDDGSTVSSRTVVLATGMRYEPLPIPGVAERWGRSAFHCPFCHGWEVRERRLAVLDDGPHGAMRAQLLRMWSDDVVLLTHGPAVIEPVERRRLDELGIEVDERPVRAVEGEGTAIASVEFVDGPGRAIDAVLVGATLHQRSDLAAQLGAALGEVGLSPDAVQTDPMGGTGIPGLIAAGDVTGEMPSLPAAIAAGNRAAALVVRHLALG